MLHKDEQLTFSMGESGGSLYDEVYCVMSELETLEDVTEALSNVNQGEKHIDNQFTLICDYLRIEQKRLRVILDYIEKNREVA